MLGQQRELGVAGMHVVREDAALGDQTVLAVGVQVMHRAGKQPGHRGDLGDVLVDVRGEPDALAEELRADVEHLVGGGQREPGRDRRGDFGARGDRDAFSGTA